jgi:hypothetical protein
MRAFALALMLAGLASAILYGLAGDSEQMPRFPQQTLATDLAGGYQVVACDLNKDGKPDLIALASNMTDLVWFENPGWQRHVIASNLHKMINAAGWDIDGDGIPEIAVAYGFSMRPAESIGNVAILHHDGDPRQPWTVHEIDRLPTSHRLRWANIDGSGERVLVNAALANASAHAPDYRGHVPLVYYRPGDWKRNVISDAEEGILHGIYVTDWRGNGRDELLIGSFLGVHVYGYQPNGGWSRSEITRGDPEAWPKSGTSDIAVGRLKGERFLATIEPWHGNEVVIYRQMRAAASQGAWNRQVIDTTLLDGHTILTGDFDGDGSDEVVVGYRGKPYGVYLYKFHAGKWNREAIDMGGMSAAGCAIADLDGNGRPAIACIGSATHNLKVYRLRGPRVDH